MMRGRNLASLSPSEQRMADLASARAWLRARGFNSKPDGFVAETPIPRYCVTGMPHYLTGSALITLARRHGWTPAFAGPAAWAGTAAYGRGRTG